MERVVRGWILTLAALLIGFVSISGPSGVDAEDQPRPRSAHPPHRSVAIEEVPNTANTNSSADHREVNRVRSDHAESPFRAALIEEPDGAFRAGLVEKPRGFDEAARVERPNGFYRAAAVEEPKGLREAAAVEEPEGLWEAAQVERTHEKRSAKKLEPKTPAARPERSEARASTHSHSPPEPQTISEKIHAVFGSEGAKAVRIARCESDLNPRAYNGSDPHGGSYGLFQINGVHLRGFLRGHAPHDLYDPDFNIRAAHQLWESSGWGPWACGGA